MRKILFALALFCVFSLSLVACGSDQSISSTDDESIETNPTESTFQYTEEDISISCADLQSNLNEWHRYAIEVSHSTDKYLNAEIVGTVTDESGNELGRKTVFVNNLGPSPLDWASVPFLAKNTSGEAFFDYEIISFSFSDGWPEMPDITDNNISEYIRIETVDYGDIVGNELHVSVTVYNLTPQEFTGTLNFTIFDGDGNIVCEESEQISGLSPFSDRELILWSPEFENYTVTYAISDYSFS